MFSRAFRLLGVSWRVVMAEKSLLALPLIAMAVSLLVIAVFALGAFGIGLPADGQETNPALYVLGFVLYVVLAFVAIFANAAVVGVAMKRLDGEDPTLGDGIALARAHLMQIFLWSVVTATVGMIIRSIQSNENPIARILAAIAGVAWNVLTFFVVPVLLFEDVSVGAALKRSGAIFRERWGETFVGTATIGLALFLVSIPAFAVGVVLLGSVPVLGIAVIALVAATLVALSGALTGVFNTALYRFATTGTAGGGFSEEDLAASFRRRRGRGAGAMLGS
jgi:hypothetical protein